MKRGRDIWGQDLIPREVVWADMNDPDQEHTGARAYYYTYYASPEERKAMDAEDWQSVTGEKPTFRGLVTIGVITFLLWRAGKALWEYTLTHWKE